VVNVVQDGETDPGVPLLDIAWAVEALQFGHWLAEQHLHRGSRSRLFAFISSPTLGCLPGFILLGCILRNGLGAGQPEEGNQACVRRFLRLWESGEGSLLEGPQRNYNNRPFNRYRITALKEDRDGRKYVSRSHFRDHPELIPHLGKYTIYVRKWDVHRNLYYLLKPNEHILKYALKDQTHYERILDEVRMAANIESTDESYPRSLLFLAGPSRKNFATLYDGLTLRSKDGQGSVTLLHLMNLDGDGRNLNPGHWHDGSWLNPKARRLQGRSATLKQGISIVDGPASWERWHKTLQLCTRILVFSRTSSGLRYGRIRTILGQVQPNLGAPLKQVGHPWFGDFHPIRAFVHEWL
jgi:hypothetical protein